RPLLELHGNYRVRAELFYQFSLGRRDPAASALWAQPQGNSYTSANGNGPLGPATCTQDEAGVGTDTNPLNATYGCKSGTQAGANMRFRLDPELHISDNLRVISQIDLLDNVVLGSTPGGYHVSPAGTASGYAVAARSGYTPTSFSTTTTAPPTSGVNSLKDSIAVKRVWAEFSTPVGELRFGRMPNHWGLGIVDNAGDGYDDNYQSTIDRIQFTTGIKPLDLYVTGAWDFVNEGATSDALGIQTGQPYDLSQEDDVTEYVLQIAHKKSREMTRLSLAKGDVVINGGVQVKYRHQLLADDQNGENATCAVGAASLGCMPVASTGANGTSTAPALSFVRTGATSWTPDLWLQVLYKRFRFETEAVTIQANIDNNQTNAASASATANVGYKVRQYGLATEIEQRLVEDKLHLGFNFGWASGDSDIQGLSPPLYGAPSQHGDRTDSEFRFNPAYTVDLILYRNILSRVEGTYYFRPSVGYDFLRDVTGQKLGGSVAAIWSRASEFLQSPGHARDLGIELNGSVYFQSKDGALNDDPSKMGGFFTKIEYGVLFPMAGLGYTPTDANAIQGGSSSTSAAQTLRWYLGAFF
ncbi:MAG TPA: TIGR04551 family protein, partial [Polyangiaceae bacterium]